MKFMLNSQIRKALLHFKGFTFTSISKTLKCNPDFSSFSLKFFATSTSSEGRHSFAASYLIDSYGFSPETALKASVRLSFNNRKKPDSVISFFRSLGFSNPQIDNIVRREPHLLSYSEKVLLPKIEFLRSKGASDSDIVRIVNLGPKLLSRSLENHIIPTYEFLKGFIETDKLIIARLISYSSILSHGSVEPNIKLFLDNGLPHSSIVSLLRTRPSLLCSTGYSLLETVEELKGMGFNSSTTTFVTALIAKRTVNKVKWAEKVKTFEKWGWSQDEVLGAFRRQPYTMLSSTDKIDAIFSFWVNQLSFNSLDLVKAPGLFVLSLEKRIIPRASVVKLLVSKGLRKKDAGITTPFFVNEKLFLENFVKRFKEDSSHLLKLYEDKLNLASAGNSTSM